MMIIAAAIQIGGMTVSLPPPARHHTIMSALHDWKEGAGQVGPDAQGFLTSVGTFVGREDACRIAQSAGQIVEKTFPTHLLFSEDLW